MSLQTLAASIKKLWNEHLNQMDVQRSLQRLVAGESRCCFEMLDVVPARGGQVMARRYRAGTNLRALWGSHTPLG